MSENQPNQRRDPVAIVGIGCRFPGQASDPKSFWRLLEQGVDAIGEVPADRWDVDAIYHDERSAPGRSYAKWGGFVDGIDQFDAQYFGISPREAASMDPQTRLLLEVATEAMADGGQAPARLADRTSVFVGLSGSDYQDILLADRRYIDGYTATGSAMSIAANRISHAFDFHGPSVAVDTACSSSLVAVHMACQSLWSGESELALAGGACLLLRPEMTIGFSKGFMLSPDGRCKAFDARANGFVRGEGAGIVVLKPLAAAQRDGDRIYGVVLATNINQDGHTPTGIAVPNVDAQIASLRSAYAKAGVEGHDVDYVEAHGPGTPVGDPIEVTALGTVLGQGRGQGRELVVGSVKTNIGHLEPAAGIAGLIKSVLALHHRAIPKNLHFETPNPDIPFDDLGVRVSSELTAWEPNGHPRVAGVNSFGFGGTNAHIVLGGAEHAPPAAPDEARPPASDALAPTLTPLSAASDAALTAVAEAWIEELAGTDATLASLAATQAHRRAPLAHRLAVVAQSRDELAERLRAVVAGEEAPGVARARVPQSAPQVAFVYCGMGSHWWAMGRELMAQEPVFRAAIEEVDQAFAALTTEWSLARELRCDEESSRIERFDIAQPAMFAIQVALTRLLRSRGVQPDAIVGHSVGEAAAAHGAGVLSLEDAAAVVYHRSRLQVLTQGHGGLLAVELSEDQVQPYLRGREDGASVAAVNSPGTVTLSGDQPTLEAIAGELVEADVFHRLLRADVPAHSAKMDPYVDELVQSLQHVTTRSGELPLYSTVLGTQIEPAQLGARYWGDNFRQPVRFADAIDALIDDGVTSFVEIAPHRVLSQSIAQIGAARSTEVHAVPPMLRETAERETLLAAIGELWAMGCTVDLGRVIADAPPADLPRYPWERQRYWHEPPCSVQARLPQIARPLVGRRLDAPTPTWELRIDEHNHRYLYDHDVQGAVIFPAAGFAEMAMSAAAELHGDGPVLVEDLHLEKALFMPPNETVLARVSVDERTGRFEIHGRPEGEEAWCRHAHGRVERWAQHYQQAGEQDDELTGADFADAEARCDRAMSHDEFYAKLGRMGDDFGPMFQGVRSVRRGDGEAVVDIEVPVELRGDLPEHCVHPVLLDACFQSIIANLPRQAEGSALPVHLRELRVLRQALTGRYVTHSRLAPTADGGFVGDLDVLDEEGHRVLEVRGFSFRSLESNERAARSAADRGIVHRYRWEHAPRSADDSVREVPAAVPSPSAVAQQLDFGRLTSELGRATHYAVHRPALEAVAHAFIAEALRELGFDLGRGAFVDGHDLAARLGVDSRAERVLHRMLDVLADAEVLRPESAGFRVVRELEVDAGALLRELSRRMPAYDAELTLIARSGPALAAVLRGEADPLTLLFPDGLLEDAARLYEHAPTARIYNRMVVHALRAMAEALPAGRRLRVLEVGAGTGGTATHVLAGLDPERIEYVFTDVSPAFLERAETELARYQPELRVLDLERDPAEQGFEPHSFDVVLAADVVHATRSVSRTLNGIRSLLSSEGRLLLLELTAAPAWIDITFGLLDGWWCFEDADLRTGSPLLGAEAWRQVLEAHGFGDVAVMTDTQPEDAEQCVLLCRGPRLEQPRSIEIPAPHVPTREATWLLVADDGGVADAVATRLRAAGRRVVTAPADADVARVVEQARSLGALEGVAHFAALDLPRTDLTTAADLEAACTRGPESVTALVQALNRGENAGAAPRLWLVTEGADALQRASADTSATQAGVWGIGRVIANEHPELRCSTVDVGDARSADDLAALADELLANEPEDAIALRGGERFVQRWETTALQGAPEPTRDHVVQTAAADGQISESDLQPLAAGQVRVRVHAASGGCVATGDEPSLARACAGVVVGVASNVDAHPGDRVIALADSAATHVVVDAQLIAPMPAHLSFEEAATLPLASVVARRAFAGSAEVFEGQCVLVHGGWTDVGLAALTHCAQRGARVFATARNSGDAELLTRFGVDGVVPADALDLAGQLLRCAGTERMDVVLCAATTAGTRVSPALVADGGVITWVDPAPGEAAAAVTHGAALALDTRRLIEDTPDEAGELLRAAMRDCSDRRAPGLPHTVVSFADGDRARRTLERSSHRGALVVTTSDVLLRRAAAPSRSLHIRPDATYLITGGLGGFGRQLAHWLVERGAHHLVLLGRHGAARPDARDAVDDLRNLGAEVRVLAADVANPADVARALDTVREHMPPLRGVVHAAMFLRDAVIDQLDRDTIHRVWSPKVAGAFALHQQTRGMELDFFVSFSSFAGLVGNPGQGAYAAANAVLDALAEHRVTRGEVGLSIDWGSIASVGYVSERAAIAAHLERIGIEPLDVDVALDGFGQLIADRVPQAAVIAVDFGRWCATHPAGATPRFEHVRELAGAEDATDGEAATSAGAVQAALRSAAPEVQLEMLAERARKAVARALRMPGDDLETDRSLTELGFDSLMGVELRTRLHDELGIDVPTMKIMKGPSVNELAAILQATLSPQAGPTVLSERAPSPSRERLAVQYARPNARRRLICFPYNGGTTATYHHWGRELGEDVEVGVVRIPGQLDRPDEPSPDCIRQLAEQLAADLEAEGAFDRPFVFYGHSLGGLVAYELAAELQRTGRPGPEHLFVGACHAPHLDDPFPAPDRLTDRASLEALGMAEALAPVLDDREFLDDIQPVVEAGMKMIKAYQHGGEVLACPISALGGKDDAVVRAEHVAAWRCHTSVEFVEHRLAGGHLFVEHMAEEVVEVLARAVGARGERIVRRTTRLVERVAS